MAKKSRPGELVFVAGARPQMREASAANWTKAKEAEFLAVLAETCNVSRACLVAEVGLTSAYRRKRLNAAFRAAWLEALSIAYQRLELVLLERAFNGTEKIVRRKDGSDETMREYSNQLGMALLKLHRDTVVEAAPENFPEDIKEVRARLVSKFQRLRKRYEAEDRPSE